MNYIIFPGELDLRRGGPSGYIANLYEGLNKINLNNEVKIICNDNSLIQNNQNTISKFKRLIGKSNFITEKLMERKVIDLRDISIRHKLNNFKPNHTDLIHVHSVMDFNKIKEYKFTSKVILTPHVPESIADEYVALIRNTFMNHSLKLEGLRYKIKQIENKAFQECEYLIFPSKEAMGIYSAFIDNFDEIIKSKKVYYNMTGSKSLSYKLNKEQFRLKYKIPKDAFVISYIGRHNLIKGFDILAEVAKEIYKLDPNVIFISGGTGNIRSNSENFIEIGWTDDPGSIVNGSDLFVLPNRNTYFDLVLLEVLSLGIPVLASNTGGNKTIAQLTDGVKLFESENIKEIVSNVINLKDQKELLLKMGNDNSECYNKFFTLEKFSRRYIDILNEIKNN